MRDSEARRTGGSTIGNASDFWWLPPWRLTLFIVLVGLTGGVLMVGTGAWVMAHLDTDNGSWRGPVPSRHSLIGWLLAMF
jgi:hypothetical protein